MIDRVEQRLADLDGLVSALIFLNEHAEDDELPTVRLCAVSLLYLATDVLSAAERELQRSQVNA